MLNENVCDEYVCTVERSPYIASSICVKLCGRAAIDIILFAHQHKPHALVLCTHINFPLNHFDFLQLWHSLHPTSVAC